MSDEYLWDRSGPPDPEVQKLETLLSRFRHDQPAPEFPAPIILPVRATWRTWVPALATAVVLLIAGGTWLGLHYFRATAGWEVASLNGTPRAGVSLLRVNGRLAVGQWLETDAVSSASLRVDGLGQVDVGPNTRLRLLKASEAQEHLALERGTIHAEILAPPFVFVTHTPSGYAMDMGCAYTIHVAENGATFLQVTSGWVQFQHWDRQSMVPAGAAAETRPNLGPGAPYFEDASEQFRAALETVNFDLADSQARSAALTVLLVEARPKDTFTLLNLFRRVAPEDRGRVFDRLAELLPPPAGVTREDAIEGNWRAIDPWWDKLGLGHPKKGLKRPPTVEE